jgi:hypothetical protein
VDFCLAFDGRERSTRGIQDQVLGKKATVSELWLVFKGSFGKSLGTNLRTRHTVLSANHIENGCIVLPVARNKLKISKRDDNFQACNETSTVFGSYTGIEYRSRMEIPRVTVTEKSKIFTARKPPTLPESWVDSYGQTEPLFWQEAKPIEVWQSIIQDYQIKAIFDLSPGSGALAEAALNECIVYHGICEAPRQRSVEAVRWSVVGWSDGQRVSRRSLHAEARIRPTWPG